MSFKIVLIGDAECGKTTFIARHRTGEFLKTYNPTLGVEISPLSLNTNRGRYTLNVWDCAGQDKFAELKSGYYIDADMALLFFDVSRKETYERLGYHLANFRKMSRAPVLICGNKVDMKNRQVKPSRILFPRQNNLAYFDISAKSNYQYECPFLYALRTFLRDPQVRFIEQSPVLVSSL